MKLSIVSTLYYSEAYIEDFYYRSTRAAENIFGDDYEIIFVNDGSPDESLLKVCSIANKDAHVKVINLSRNFGHHKAMMTGLSVARGDLIYLIDSDLEEQPEWLNEFYFELINKSADLVYGVQKKRKGTIGEMLFGWLYYKIFRWLTNINQPNNILTVRLMTKRYARSLLRHKERELNIGGLYIITGYKQAFLELHKKDTSPTTYSFTRKINHFINGITSFSNSPLIFIFYFGIFISCTAIIYIIYLALRFIFIATPPNGYMSIILSIWLFSGIIILFIGLIGIYISKIFIEVKRRPYTIISDIYQKDK